jgi:hypothetical protein
MSIRRIYRPIALNKQKLSTNGDSDIRLFLTLIELQVMRMRDSNGSYVTCVCWPHVYQRQQYDSDSALNCFEIRSQAEGRRNWLQ